MTLRRQILVAMLAVTALAVLLAGIVTRQTTLANARTVVDLGLFDDDIDLVLAHRERTGSWDGVDEVLARIDRRELVRVVLTDLDDRVIADSRPDEPLPSLIDLPAYPLELDDDTWLLHAFEQVLGEDPTTRGIIASFDRTLTIAALVALLLAGLAAIVVSRRIGRPVSEVAEVVGRIRDGDLEARSIVCGADEIGELANGVNALAAELARSEAARTAQVADTAHELRTPLANLSGHLEGMLDGVVEVNDETLTALLDDATRLARLVDDLQSLALADAGQLTLHVQPLPLADVGARLDERSRHAAARTGATLTVRADAGHVLADPTRLDQVLDNLVANALRHATNVVVELDTEGHVATLVVRDDGPGIPESALPTIFDRFTRADPARQRDAAAPAVGAGLGLAIVAQLVRLQHGTVTATNAPDGGAVLTVTLPGVDA